MKFAVKAPPVQRTLERAGAQHRKDLRAAAVYATDKASKDGQRIVQNRIRSVGLGRLAGAVGHTSTQKERSAGRGKDPYGVIFARGGNESLAGGALESYSRGAVIRAQQKQWLAFATPAIPRFVSVGGRRFRTTPQLYRASGLNNSIGPLVFKPISTNKAILVVKKVTLSPKTGQAKAQGSRRSRTRVPAKEVVAFVLIRSTRRAQRFDKDQIMRGVSTRVPGFMSEYLRGLK